MKTRLVRIVLALAVLGGALPGAARGSEVLRRELGTFAKKIHAALTEEGQDSIAVGEFTGPAGFDASAGPGIQQVLIDELKGLGVSVKRRTAVSVKGEYLVVDDQRDTDRVVLRLVAVVRRGGTKLTELQTDIRSNLDLIQLLGLTVKLPILGDEASRNEAIKKEAEEPRTARTSGTMIQADPASPYGVEVLVKGNPTEEARPRAATVKDGQAFVPITRGELYEIRVHNNSKFEAAVSVTVDGLSVFNFSEVRDDKGKPKYSHFIVGPGKSFSVVGWHRTNKRSDSFEVMELAKTPAAQLLQGSNSVGTITVCFHAAWEGDNVPPDEKGARSGGDATGFGPPRTTDLREVARHIGVLREAVSVRYTKR